MAIANEVKNERPSTSVFAFGRVFYGTGSVVYFSQVLEQLGADVIGFCYQRNDPTSGDISDLLDTDGGTIPLNGSTSILKIVEFSNGVLCFSQNGVWYIAGPEQGFTATNFSVKRVSTKGCFSPKAIIQVEDFIYYWGKDSINIIEANEYGQVKITDIAESSIKSFYQELSSDAKNSAVSGYNKVDKQIETFYSERDKTATNAAHPSNERSIIYDIRSQGWFPQSNRGAEFEANTGGLNSSRMISGGLTMGVTSDEYLLVGVKTDINLGVDWHTFLAAKSGDGTDDLSQGAYETAFVETGYETLAKPSNSKSAPYVYTHFSQTEENWVADGMGGFELDRPSGVNMRAQWDWNNSTANGRFSPYQQAYRFRRLYVPSGAGVFDSGETVISTKNKVLGRGKALSLRFEQESGKEMQLLGYTIQWSIKGRM